MKAQEYLRSIGACAEAREWVGNKSLREAWSTCPRADWMLWLLDKRAPLTKEQAVQLACAFARRVLPLVPAGEARPRLAIEAAEQWLVAQSPENRANAATAAATAATAAAYAAAGRAAAYAAYADAADAAAYAAYAAAYAAYAAYAAAHAAAHADAAERAAQADIIRAIIPYPAANGSNP